MTSPVRQAIERLAIGTIDALPKRAVAHLLFLLRHRPDITDRIGYHIRPIHYYDPVPDFRTISADQLLRRRENPAIDFAPAAQAALLAELAQYRGELDAIADAGRFDFANTMFAGIDACIHYALVRSIAPRRIVEIGSGNSTHIASLALERNRAEGKDGAITCIEPYPEPRLLESGAEFTLIEQRVQDVDPAIFVSLAAGDILFIDSSHVIATGSDVFTEFLDILPRLASGVWVHVHDIFFPHDYPPQWVLKDRVAFNEQYLLEAFLAFNTRFTVKLIAHWMLLDHADLAARLCPAVALDANPLGGNSFWMMRDAD